MKNVFDYTDYRKLMREYYEARKAISPHFSYQRFATAAGYSTKAYILRVISGQRELSRSSIFSVAQAMGLKGKEIDYFEALVLFNQARTYKERQHYFGRLQACGRAQKAVLLRERYLAYFSQWHHSVIRELVTMKDWRGDWQALGKAVCPAIAADKARQSVELLLELGLIRSMAGGRYAQVNKAVSAGDEITRMGVHAFQRQTMTLASRALDRFPKTERDISTLTVGLSKKGMARVSEELSAFRRYISQIATSDDHAERVFQMNFQLYPVSASNIKE